MNASYQKVKQLIKNLNKPYVMILVGPPLSGKSTLIKELLLEDAGITVISRDQIVLDNHVNDNYNEAFKTVNQRDVDSTLKAQLHAAAEGSTNVIIDMTHLSAKRRKHHLSFFKDENFHSIAVVFPVLEWEQYLERNKKREVEEFKTIPHGILKSMINSLQSVDKAKEGFDSVINI